MNEIFEQFRKTGVIPVVVLDDVKDALPLAEALCQGGLPCAEVTFRTAAAEDSIRQISENFPGMLVGAGTVLTCEQADRAIDAGAKFVVSPGFNPTVTRFVLDAGLPMCPGICTPTEIEAALQFDLDVLKFFPAEPSGGLPMIKALAAPYVGVNFMPTGGISPANVRDYLDYDRIVACGGSWMVKPELIREGNFTEIQRLAREAADIVKAVRN